MTITASMVKELRARTSVGMMDCKAALTETGGDMDKAIEFLRMKGLAKAAKRADHATTAGKVAMIAGLAFAAAMKLAEVGFYVFGWTYLRRSAVSPDPGPDVAEVVES